MKIEFTSRKLELKDSFVERVNRKLGKLDKFFTDDSAAAFVTVTKERERYTVEVTIKSQGMIFRAEKTTSEMFDSLEATMDLIIKQIVKNKRKLEKRFTASDFKFEEGYEYYEPNVIEGGYNVARIKKINAKPMDVQEAILQMNMLNHEFFVFTDFDTDAVSVVYKRKEGDYGLLETSSD